MWIRRSQAFFLLVKISRSGVNHGLFRRLTIPVPLFMVDDLLDSFYSLARCGEAIGKLISPSSGNAYQPGRRVQLGIKVSPGIKILQEMIEELRRAGRITLVDIDTEGVKFNLDLY